LERRSETTEKLTFSQKYVRFVLKYATGMKCFCKPKYGLLQKPSKNIDRQIDLLYHCHSLWS